MCSNHRSRRALCNASNTVSNHHAVGGCQQHCCVSQGFSTSDFGNPDGSVSKRFQLCNLLAHLCHRLPVEVEGPNSDFSKYDVHLQLLHLRIDRLTVLEAS